MLLASDLDYGLARVWRAYAGELLRYQSQVFGDRGEALAWLQG